MKAILLSVFIILASTLLGGIAAHYYISYNETIAPPTNQTLQALKDDNITSLSTGSQLLKIYYPDNGSIAYAEMSIQLDFSYPLKPIELALAELSKRLAVFDIDLKVHNIYKDTENIIYIDISDTIAQKTLNTIDEYNIVLAISKTVFANADFATGVKILKGTKESETLAGHISIMHPIRQ